MEQCTLPVMIRGADTLFLTQTTATKLKVVQRRLKMSLLGLLENEQVLQMLSSAYHGWGPEKL